MIAMGVQLLFHHLSFQLFGLRLMLSLLVMIMHVTEGMVANKPLSVSVLGSIQTQRARPLYNINHELWTWRQDMMTSNDGKTTTTTYNHDGQKLGLQYKLQPSSEKRNDCLPLILIHPVGIGLSSWFWEPFMEAWTYSDVFCPDLIGCGQLGDEWNPGVKGMAFPLEWARQCETLIEDFLNSQPCVVMVQGGLAPVGILLGQRNASTVKKLILCSPPTWSDLTTPLSQSLLKRNYDFLRSEYGAAAFSLLERRWAIKFFSDLFLFADKADSIWIDRAINDCSIANRSAVAVFNAGLLQHRSYEEDLKELLQPTLILAGETDKRQFDRNPFKRNMLDCSLGTLPGCNVLPWESVDSLIYTIQPFLLNS